MLFKGVIWFISSISAYEYYHTNDDNLFTDKLSLPNDMERNAMVTYIINLYRRCNSTKKGIRQISLETKTKVINFPIFIFVSIFCSMLFICYLSLKAMTWWIGWIGMFYTILSTHSEDPFFPSLKNQITKNKKRP